VCNKSRYLFTETIHGTAKSVAGRLYDPARRNKQASHYPMRIRRILVPAGVERNAMDDLAAAWLNSTRNLASVLLNISDPETADRLSSGPINGWIGIREIYFTFDDFYHNGEPGDKPANFQGLPVEIDERLMRFKMALRELAKVGRAAEDREIVKSPIWRNLQSEAGALAQGIMKRLQVEQASLKRFF